MNTSSTSEGYAANDRAIAMLRIALGVLFLILASYKVTGTNFIMGTAPTSFQWWMDQFISRGGAYPFAVPLITDVLKPIGWPIAALAAFGELAIGLSLVTGIWVRVASAFGFVYMIALLFMTNYPGPNAAFWAYFGRSVGHLVPALCFAAFIVGKPHLAWSLRRQPLATGRAHDRLSAPAP